MSQSSLCREIRPLVHRPLPRRYHAPCPENRGKAGGSATVPALDVHIAALEVLYASAWACYHLLHKYSLDRSKMDAASGIDDLPMPLSQSLSQSSACTRSSTGGGWPVMSAVMTTAHNGPNQRASSASGNKAALAELVIPTPHHQQVWEIRFGLGLFGCVTRSGDRSPCWGSNHRGRTRLTAAAGVPSLRTHADSRDRVRRQLEEQFAGSTNVNDRRSRMAVTILKL